MINLQRILHPTDFSINSYLALQYAYAFTNRFKAELHLLHVATDPTTVAPLPIPGYVPESYYQDIMKNAEQKLEGIPENEWVKEAKIVRKVIEGNPFVEIISYAKENSIDMIVMGTHGYTGIMHLIMGSVAENIVRNAKCPVMTIHPDDHQFVKP